MNDDLNISYPRSEQFEEHNDQNYLQEHQETSSLASTVIYTGKMQIPTQGR